MPLTSAQLITRACATAHVSGFTAQGADYLNSILQELCQNYDFEAARGLAVVNISPSLGSGPYVLPADYLRMAKNEVIYYVSGVPYVMVNIDLAEYDALVQQAGISNYPENFATDTSVAAQTLNGGPVMYVWPPSGGNYSVNIRYFRQMPDIASAATSTVVPWFPDQNYLTTRLSGELMKYADDDRWQAFLGDGPVGAQGILNRFLKLQSDDDGRVKTVSLDRRRFGSSFNRLPQTKLLGW